MLETTSWSFHYASLKAHVNAPTRLRSGRRIRLKVGRTIDLAIDRRGFVGGGVILMAAGRSWAAAVKASGASLE
jgi:hypothetical protein